MTYRQPETCPRCPGAVRCGMSRAAPLAGVGRGGRGAEPPQHGQGPLPPLCGAPPFARAALEQLNEPGFNAAANPPGQRRGGLSLGLGHGLGQGGKRLSRGVVRCAHLAALDGRGLSRGVVRFVDSIIHDGTSST